MEMFPVLVSTRSVEAVEAPGERASAAVTKLASGGAALLFASAAGNALSYAFGIFVARALGAEQFGLYALGLTLFNLLALFAPIGLDVGLLKFVSGRLAAGERALARRDIIYAGAIAIGCGLLASVGLILFAPILSNSIYHKPALSGVLLFFAAALPFVTFTTVILGGLQAFQNVRYIILVKYIWEPAGKFLLAALALALGFGIFGLLGALGAVFVISSLIALRGMARVLPLERAVSGRHADPLYALLAFSTPLIVSNLFSVLAPRSDMLILGYWVNAEQVGIYNAAFQTSAMIALVLGALDTAVAPVIGGLVGRKDVDTIKTLYQVTSRWGLTLAAPIFVVMALWGGDLLSLFGPAFALGAPCLLILALAQLFNTATGPTTSILLMSGHSRMIMIDSILNGILLISINMALIPKYGVFGAAIGSAICQALVSVVRVAQVWQVQRILPFSISMAKPAAAATIAAMIGWAMRREVGGGPSAQLALSGFVVGIFFGALFLFGVDSADYLTTSELWKKINGAARFSRL